MFTRTQVNAAKGALGLDPDLTASVGIFPGGVYTETVQQDDGGPIIRDGALTLIREDHTIDEEAGHGDS